MTSHSTLSITYSDPIPRLRLKESLIPINLRWVAGSLLASCAVLGIGPSALPRAAVIRPINEAKPQAAPTLSPGQVKVILATPHCASGEEKPQLRSDALPQLSPSWAAVRIALPDVTTTSLTSSVESEPPSLAAAVSPDQADVPPVSLEPETVTEAQSERALATAPPRKVDIEQISSDLPVVEFASQTPEAKQDVWGGTFADKAAAMQIPLPPPPQLAEIEAAGLQATAPVVMTVRLGTEAIGNVAFRMNEQRSVDVQLAGLLDLVSEHLSVSDYARLRTSAAADNFVSLEQLRQAGLNLRYDPVYDELRLTA